ncbi:AAA family ATPase [Aureimonas mangrovi]|uniref:AAA family ATPase n=1 Tax=Aureimonas mangrovi TaxID=2758041 RepID=UPI00163D8E04|nr:AAA family ATPase [Aureimonas mangrovi]
MATANTPGLRSIRSVGKGLPLRDDVPDFRTDLEPEDEDVDDASNARRLADQRVEGLSPSAYAPFILLRDAIPADLRDRLVAGHRMCLVARIPRTAWVQPIGEALRAVIGDLRADAGLEIGHGMAFAEKHYRGAGLEIDLVVSSLREAHVIVPLLPKETLNHVIPALADLELNLHPTGEMLAAAIRRQFPDAGAWPDEIDVLDVHPNAIELICQRAASGSHAFEMLGRLAQADRDERERKSGEKKVETEKQPESETDRRRRHAATPILRPTSPTLTDLHGYGAAAAWGADLVRDLHDYRDGRLPWSDVDAGCLLSGPPGTGKTLFASALAASSGLPFIATSYADWQSQGDGHLGYVIKGIRRRFEDALAAAPAILFIDELDTVGTRGQRGDADGWWSAVITSLLEHLDGTTRREGLVVLAACNEPSKIDPALLRSGRLDRRFEIGLPDEAALARIFAHHLPGGSAEAFETAATVLAGTTSGADVSRIAREARRAARRAGREIVADDLLSIAIPEETRSAETVRLVCVHEAGHAVAAFASGVSIDSLSIVSHEGLGGSVRGINIGGCGRLGDLERKVMILLAGRAAEDVLLGEPSAGAIGDLQEVTRLVGQIVGHVGLGGRLTSDEHVSTQEVESRLRDLYGRTLRLIGEHRSAVEALAQIAAQKRVLGKRALLDFAAEQGFEVRS